MAHEPVPPLVSPSGLAALAGDPALRILDCSTWLHWTPEGRIRIESGRRHYDESGHIPGAALVEIQAQLSDLVSPLRFTMPAPDAAARAFGAIGIGDHARVVLYAAGDFWWATRVWWMLRAIGFDRASILDGGFTAWCAEGRPIETVPVVHPSATLTPRPRPALFADRSTVTRALADGSAVVVNCLRPEFHCGTAANHYGRPGRIAGSVNVPAGALAGRDGRLRPPAEIDALFAAQGIAGDRPVIAYCGGGIAATGGAFALTALLGREDVAVYDASMQEWANDPSAPMETG